MEANEYRALSNPLVSMEAKEHARTILTDLDEEGAREELYREKPKSPTRVAGGLRGYVSRTMHATWSRLGLGV